MISYSQQQLDPNECGIVLLRHNANPFCVYQRFQTFPYVHIAFSCITVHLYRVYTFEERLFIISRKKSVHKRLNLPYSNRMPLDLFYPFIGKSMSLYVQHAQRDQTMFQPPEEMANRRYAASNFVFEAVSVLPGSIVEETLLFLLLQRGGTRRGQASAKTKYAT